MITRIGFGSAVCAIGANGHLVGYAGGLVAKQYLLVLEGARRGSALT
jgi:hypothetical protein